MDASREKPTTKTAACYKCGKPFEVKGRLMIGEVFDCKACHAPHEVARLKPLQMVPLARIEEDIVDFDML